MSRTIEDKAFAALGADYASAPTGHDVVEDSSSQTTLTKGVYRVISSVACYLLAGSNPTAAADSTSHYLPADTYLDPPLVISGSNLKVAVIRAGDDDGVIQYCKVL